MHFSERDDRRICEQLVRTHLMPELCHTCFVPGVPSVCAGCICVEKIFFGWLSFVAYFELRPIDQKAFKHANISCGVFVNVKEMAVFSRQSRRI